MNRILSFFAVALLLSSCTVKNELTEDVTVNITVGALTEPSKAVKTGWNVDDKIFIWFDGAYTKDAQLTITYNGTKWLSSGPASGVTLKSSGTINALFVGGNDLAAWTDFSDGKRYPAKGDGDNTSRRMPLTVVSNNCAYTYSGGCLTSNLTNWNFLSKIQIVVTGLDASKADKYAMRVNDFKAFSSVDNTASGLAAGNISDAGTVAGVANEDGVAFYFNDTNCSGESNEYIFTLDDYTTGSKLTRNYGKNGTITTGSNKLVGIRIVSADGTVTTEDVVFNYSSCFEDVNNNGWVSWTSGALGLTKASLPPSLDMCWNADDRLSVFSTGVANAQYRFTGETGAKTGSFSKVADGGSAGSMSHTYAIYPYNSSASSSADGVFTVNYPSVQNYTSSYLAGGCATLVAAASSMSDPNIKFLNACGNLGLRLYSSADGTIQSIELSGNNSEKIAGPATLTVKDGQAPTVEMSPSATSKVTVNVGGAISLSTSASNPTIIYVALPPVTFSKGIQVVVNCSDKSVGKSATGAFSIDRSTLSTMETVATVSTVINGTAILDGNDLYGLITNSSTSQGIAGVPVTDGYQYVLTDANGVYQMKQNSKVRNVYYSLPAGYKTAMSSDNRPRFYSDRIYSSNVNRVDFSLTPKSKDETNWTLFSIADPQLVDNASASRFDSETIDDIVSRINNGRSSSKYQNIYGVSLGDNVDYSDTGSEGMFPAARSAMSNVGLSAGDYLPIYQCIGNHDHCHNSSSEYEATQKFIDYFGPTDYSFNIGKAHVVVFDNYYFEGTPHSDDDQWGGVTKEQLDWLAADLNTVADKANTLLIVCNHVPFGYAPGTRDFVHSSHYYDSMMGLFAQFHDAHLMSGHTHFAMNFVHNEYKAKSGRGIYEHNQATANGYQWSSLGDVNMDGSPLSYYIYEIEGNEITDWRLQANNGADENRQLRVFDGNQIWYDPNGGSQSCSWWNQSAFNGIDPYYGVASLEDAMVVSVWDGDFENWTVKLNLNGTDYTLQPLSDYNYCTCDMPTLALYHDPWGWGLLRESRHYWYVKLPGIDISKASGWMVTAEQTVPSSKNVKHTYWTNGLQTDFWGYGL